MEEDEDEKEEEKNDYPGMRGRTEEIKIRKERDGNSTQQSQRWRRPSRSVSRPRTG